MSAPEVIRLVVADDHAVVLAGLTAILESAGGLSVVAGARDGVEALEAYRDHRPDVLLMDLRMPRLDGLGALERLRETDPEARVLLLTTYDDEEDIYRGLESGASGYLLKDSAPNELVESVRRVHEGRRVISPQAAERLASRMSLRELTAREREVLQHLAEGKSNKQIARSLEIAEGTVKVHVANLIEKLCVQGRSEAVAAAIRRGLVRIE